MKFHQSVLLVMQYGDKGCQEDYVRLRQKSCNNGFRKNDYVIMVLNPADLGADGEVAQDMLSGSWSVFLKYP